MRARATPKARSMTGRATGFVGDPLVPGAGVRDVTAQRRLALLGEARGNANVGRCVVDRVQIGEHARPWPTAAPSCTIAGGVVEPVVPERVRHEVGRDHAVDAAHDEERRADVTWFALRPVQLGHRDRRQPPDVGDHPELAIEVVRREHGDIGRVGRDAGDELVAAGRPSRRPTRRSAGSCRSTARSRRSADRSVTCGDASAGSGTRSHLCELFDAARRRSRLDRCSSVGTGPAGSLKNWIPGVVAVRLKFVARPRYPPHP